MIDNRCVPYISPSDNSTIPRLDQLPIPCGRNGVCEEVRTWPSRFTLYRYWPGRSENITFWWTAKRVIFQKQRWGKYCHEGKYIARRHVCLETAAFFVTLSRKNNQFQDFTRADTLVQRPAFGHYLIMTKIFYSSEVFNISDVTCFISTSDSTHANKHFKVGWYKFSDKNHWGFSSIYFCRKVQQKKIFFGCGKIMFFKFF